MKKKQKLTSVENLMPERVFGLILLVRVIKKGWVVYAENETFKSSSSARQFAQRMIKSAPKKGLRVEKALLLEMSLKRIWPLKKEYWLSQRNDTPFAEIRVQLFQVFLEKYAHQSWSVVLTPKQDRLMLAMPVQNKDVESDVEAFMKYSDWYVPESANQAGIYAVDALWQLDTTERNGRKFARKKN